MKKLHLLPYFIARNFPVIFLLMLLLTIILINL